MDKNIYEILKEINSNSNKIREWGEVTDIFAKAIMQKRLAEELEEKEK